MTETPGSFGAVLDAAVALYRHKIDEDQFVAAVVALPIVQQNPRTEPPFPLWDPWFPAEGPISGLQRVHLARLIWNKTYDRALDAMADAGHQA